MIAQTGPATEKTPNKKFQETQVKGSDPFYCDPIYFY